MGSLHERNVSYWIASSEATDYPPLPTPHETEVCVVGAGLTGLLTAYMLSLRGTQVTLIEAGRVCSGVTGYTTAKITSQHGLKYARLVKQHGEPLARIYASAQQAGLELLYWLSEEIPCEFRHMPSFVYTERPDMVDELEREAEIAAELGLPASFTQTHDLPFEIAGAVRFENQGLFHPRRFCLGVAEKLVARGCVVAENTRAQDASDGDPCVVTTDRGEIRARAVVLATHMPFLQSGLLYARTTPSRSYVVAGRRAELPNGMYISHEQPTRSIRPHPSDDGNVLLIGGQGHGTGRDADTERHYRELETFAWDHFGVNETEWRWSAQDFDPANGLPYIGSPGPLRPHTYVATGFAKWGMTNAAAAASAITALIAGRETNWARAARAGRIDIARSLGTMVSQSVETMKSMVGDRLGMLASPDVAALQPGEGRIVRVGGRHVAAFRDEGGAVQAVSARCTHMGCIVHFNRAERSWDCPCHGSRFGLDGRVLDGPATKDLEQFS